MTKLSMVLMGITLIFTAILTPASAYADAVDTNLALALQKQEAGELEAAILLYESAVEAGHVNGHVFYNLGHAYFRKGEVGKSMAAMLEARRLLPRNPDVKANLKFMEKRTKDNLKSNVEGGVLSTLAFWLDDMTPREALTSAAILAFLVGLVLSLSYLVTRLASWRPYVWGLAILPALAFANFGLVYEQEQKHGQWGAVVASNASVYSGPQARTVLFKLNEGAPFLVVGRAAGWYQVRLSDGKKGWIRDNQAQAYGVL